MRKKFLTFIAICAAIISNTNAQTAASEIDGKKQTLFSSVNHETKPYRIPAVATLNNGTVLAIADQRPCGADIGNGEVDIYAKVGTINPDGSYSWNPSSIDPSVEGGLMIADGNSDNGYGDAAVVVDRESGKVLVICVAGNVKYSSGTSSKHNKMARIVGSADGLTWEKPQDVSSAFFANELSSAYTMFMASGKMVQSQLVKEGNYYRIYGALLVREKKNIFSAVERNYVVYSDDFGATWKVLGGTYAVSASANEAKVEELPNGDIVLSSRTSGGRIFNVFNFTNLNNAEGSWGGATTYSFAGGNSTNGELKFYKGLVDASGTEYNVMFQSLPTGSSRSNVAVYYKAFATDKSSWAVSDFTSGWTKGIEVDNGASAYSTMTILPNGQVGFLYEDEYDTNKASGDYSNIVYVPLTVEEMTGGAYTLPTPVVKKVATPVFSLPSGTYDEGTKLSVTCATEGAKIYLALDANWPAEEWVEYSEGMLEIFEDIATLYAIAKLDGWEDSDIASAEYTAIMPLTTPVINPASGKVENGTKVTITCAIEGATIYYTTDGTEPTTESAVYSAPIVVNEEMTIKAFAVKVGYTNSAVATASFTVKQPVIINEYIVKPTTGKIGNSYYYLTTFSASEPTVVPEGVTAFYADSNNDDEIILTSIPSGYAIPAGEGVILKAENSNEFKITTATENVPVANINNNHLKGTCDVVNFTFEKVNCYALTVKGSGSLKGQFTFSKVPFGKTFYGYNNRAYLDQSMSSIAFSNGFRLSFGGTTDIEPVAEEETEEIIFDLRGRRVTEMEPGNIYIINGKKVLKK